MIGKSGMKRFDVTEKIIFNNKFYSGKAEKYGVIMYGANYILKKEAGKDQLYKLCAEYFAAILGQSINVSIQKVLFCWYKGKPALMIEDFLMPGDEFVPLGGILEEQKDLEEEKSKYTYDNFLDIVYSNVRIVEKEETIKKFWLMLILDFLISNKARNASNIGFIKRRGVIRLAPVFDNSSGFCFDQSVDMHMLFQGKKQSRLDILKHFESDEKMYAINYFKENLSEKLLDSLLREIKEIDPFVEEVFRKIVFERFTSIISLGED
ncbi:MAG: hypothetical protein HDR06_11365 [Lachnospiraceae bacterium]|nr:hypothetical protein [Lachnospiraceae bacterium]